VVVEFLAGWQFLESAAETDLRTVEVVA